MMGKTLVIAEKADVGHKLAIALPFPSRRNDGAVEVNFKLLTICLLFWSGNAFAFCFEQASASFDINPDLLKAVSWVESRWLRLE